MTEEIKVIDHRQRDIVPVQSQSATPAALLQIAVAQGADISKLEKLMELKERWEANEARKAYAQAMAAFKAEDLKITKNKRVHFTSQKGTTDYKHATLDNVVAVVAAGLAKHGLMHTWRTEQPNGRVRVTCIITHEKGHFEETTLECAADESGNKNSIQAIGSAVSYLQRYTLTAATGVASGEDDDGQATSKPVAKITENQALDLETLVTDTKADKTAFFRYFQIESFRDLPNQKYGQAIAMLKKKQQAECRAPLGPG